KTRQDRIANSPGYNAAGVLPRTAAGVDCLSIIVTVVAVPVVGPVIPVGPEARPRPSIIAAVSRVSPIAAAEYRATHEPGADAGRKGSISSVRRIRGCRTRQRQRASESTCS